MPVTVGRNRRQYVVNIKSAYTAVRRYNPATGDLEPVESAEAWEVLENNREARLIEEDGRTSYTIRLGNDFFELRRPSTPSEEAEESQPA
jgi:hypothetical protein